MKNKQPIRKLTRVGRSRSLALVLPAEFVKSLGWREHQRLSVRKSGGAIVIRDAKTNRK